jgi:hypothetical protein
MHGKNRRRNEKGGILLELTIMAFLLLGMASGAAQMHRSFHRRFERIISERNESVQKLRRQTP